MAASTPDIFFGITITYGSSFLAKILDVAWDGYERGVVDTTHNTSTNGYMTKIPEDIKDPGRLTVTLQFDKNAATKTNLATTTLETITVNYPTPSGGSSGGNWACSGFLQAFSWRGSIRGPLAQATAVLEFSGEPTFTDGG